MKKPSLVGSAVKVFVALLFFIMAFDMEGDTIAVTIVIGLAFLAWALFPYKRYKDEQREIAEGRMISAGKPGIGAAIVKVTVASLFIIMAFSMDDTSSLLISLLLGAVFLFWAWFPFFRYKQNAYQETAASETPVTLAKAHVQKQRRRPCPHCGAPMVGDTCEYCGMYSED